MCHKCGFNDSSIPAPAETKRGIKEVIGICPKCSASVERYNTPRPEKSQEDTIRIGENRAGHIVRLYEKNHNCIAKKNEVMGDIDYNIYDENGILNHYLEIRTRNNSLNAFAKTMFPYRKILKARQLWKNTLKPIYFLIVFTDCTTIVKYDPYKKYETSKGSMTNNLRRSLGVTGQLQVLIPIEELKIWQNGILN